MTIKQDAFSDTSDREILIAYALGITNGVVAPTATTPGRFNPSGQFNREQAATMIRNTCKAIGANVDNPPTSDFIDLNTASDWALFGANVDSFAFVSTVYVLSILFAISPMAEGLWRSISGVRPLATRNETNRLLPLFKEVYKEAVKADPNLAKNITLYIQEDMDVKADSNHRKRS